MLASSFAETKLVPGDRKLYTVVVEEADFETIYWLLKYVYANWCLFRENDDPRMAVEGIGAGWSARWLNARGGEWDWKTFTKLPSDDSTVASATSAESIVKETNTPAAVKSKIFETDISSTTSPTRSSPQAQRTAPKTASNPASTSRQTLSTARRPSVPVANSSTIVPPPTGGVSRTKPLPLSVGSAAYSSHHYPISPRTQRHPSAVLSTADPHLHPTPAPGPASALSVYQVAHRYAMPALAALAESHLMSTITPQSSFALLLATSVWDELRALVEVGAFIFPGNKKSD
jgi:hypothetical protein